MHWYQRLNRFIDEKFIKELAPKVKSDMQATLYDYCVPKGAHYDITDRTHDGRSYSRHAASGGYRDMECKIAEPNARQ